MRAKQVMFAAAVMLAAAPAFAADEVKSGVEVGNRVGTYSSTKCAGAEDGVRTGASLCYT